ncbi:MAG: DUF6634 family protein [Cypionkella sp.]|uniref:DUF6634 family protein n=1 Tax=Cypionkella sp. TaxID=2811411 RepID=UPI002ABCF02D|nr:DUF6634 family protein [Cypionkella sp.]MDZ4312091.1 DUF6634 family protein [Cypionkella sp.]
MTLPPDLRAWLEKILASFATAEAGPTEADLAAAPTLDNWRPFVSKRGGVILWGMVSGHPRLSIGPMTTSQLLWICRDEQWARTASRWYRLGQPFAEFEAELAHSLGASGTPAAFMQFELDGFEPVDDADLLAKFMTTYITKVRAFVAEDRAACDEGR